MAAFADRICELVRSRGTPAMVGLDPRPELMPGWLRAKYALDARPGSSAWSAAIQEFCDRVLELVADKVPAVKLQSAYFELHGSHGIEAMRRVAAAARQAGLAVVLDVKRADIAATAEAYAQAYLGAGPFNLSAPFAADAITLSPYLGKDSIEPFRRAAEAAEAGLFLLVHTTNPGANDLQRLPLAERARPVYEEVASWVAEWSEGAKAPCGYGPVGAVVGAQAADVMAALRQLMPAALFLVPGYGAQGGGASQVAAAFHPTGLGALVNSSRAIVFPKGPDGRAGESLDSWQAAVREALSKMIDELAANTPAGKLRQ